MNPIFSATRFQGTFSNIPTYMLSFDAAPIPEGLPSEVLASMGTVVKKKFPDVNVQVNPYNFPAKLTITGQSVEVEQADTFVRTTLDKKHVRYQYDK